MPLDDPLLNSKSQCSRRQSALWQSSDSLVLVIVNERRQWIRRKFLGLLAGAVAWQWPGGRSSPIGCGALGCLDSAVAAPIATRAFDILRALGVRHASADDNNVPEGTNL